MKDYNSKQDKQVLVWKVTAKPGSDMDFVVFRKDNYDEAIRYAQESLLLHCEDSDDQWMQELGVAVGIELEYISKEYLEYLEAE